MGSEWMFYVICAAVFLVMLRIDRLGRQTKTAVEIGCRLVCEGA